MRSAKMDNLKGFLIVCVVLGHLLELQSGEVTDYLYLVIYSFHMPLFAWVCGYFARPADQKCLKTLVLPYVVFQLLYEFFLLHIWQYDTRLKLLEPYWLMWFILSLLLWRLLLPLVDCKKPKAQMLVLAVTAVLSLLSGKTDEIRHVLSFQRTVALFPVFLLGYYAKNWKEPVVAWWQSQDRVERAIYRAMLLTVMSGGFVLLYVFREEIDPLWFYWRYAYGGSGGSMKWRAMLLAAAVLFVALALVLTPARRLPVLTRLGRNTMPVYLLHGFVVKTLEWREIYWKVPHPWPLTLALLMGMILVFSSPPVSRLFDLCFGSGKKIKSTAVYY